MPGNKPLVLVTNDDGIHAPGIHALRETLDPIADVYVVAPHAERSGSGQALTLTSPLRATKMGETVYCTDGTPTDCVLWACHHLLPRRPDWVVSGINRGCNIGQDTLYSGTVAAAMEGCLQGARALAVSQRWSGHDTRGDYQTAARIVRLLFDNVELLAACEGGVINVNVPHLAFEEIAGFAVTRLGRRIYESRFYENTDPRGRPYYWLGGGGDEFVDIEDSDCKRLAEGYVTISILQPDRLHDSGQEAMRGGPLERLNESFASLR